MPFPDYQDHSIPVIISKGKRPSKPNFFEAPGMSPGVWKIARQCWREKEKERPETDVVLRSLETILHSGVCTHNVCICPPWEMTDLGWGKQAPSPFRLVNFAMLELRILGTQ